MVLYPIYRSVYIFFFVFRFDGYIRPLTRMGSSKETLVVMSIVIQLWCQASGEQSCSSKNPGPPCKLHRLKEGTGKCCKVATCAAGEQPVLCSSDYCVERARCEPCPDGTFQPKARVSHDMLQCEHHGVCAGRKHLVVDKIGNAINNTTCKCDLANGYYWVPELHSCKGPKSCPPGQELNETGHCNPCQHYSYFKADNGTGRCQVKTDCLAKGLEYEFKSDVNLTRDNTCKSVTSTSSPVIRTVSPDTGQPTNSPGSDRTAVIAGSVAGVAIVLVIIIIIIIVVCRRTTPPSGEAPPLPPKTRPEDSDTDSGTHSFSRQDSQESVKKQLLVENKHGLTGVDRPHVHIPQRQGSGNSISSIKTPDSGIVCGIDIAKDLEMGVTPSPEVFQKTPTAPILTQNPGKDMNNSTIKLVVNGPNCHVHVGKTIIHQGSVEQLDEIPDNVQYEVCETNE